MSAVAWILADRDRRTYLSLNRAGDAYHVVTPIAADDIRVRDGVRLVGQLTCTCEGGRFRGSCYVVRAAESLEAAASTWFDAPAGAGEEVEVLRG